jgi:hypothetical protein
MPYHFHKDGSVPERPDTVVVFGSNKAGRHGAGSALLAREQFGAEYGNGYGRQGRSYAIPTKDGRRGTPNLRDPKATLPVIEIAAYIQEFIAYAKANPDTRFFVFRLGCQLAAHKDADIAPLFKGSPLNCSFPEEWAPYLPHPA